MRRGKPYFEQARKHRFDSAMAVNAAPANEQEVAQAVGDG
jgi:hypothetical protein